MLDDTHHAASVDLNAGRLGPAHSWSDTARDVLNFVEHVLPAVQAEEAPAPWELQWEKDGRTAPQVVGIGHSYGASGLVQAANARPDLFSSLFLVEPMVSAEILRSRSPSARPSWSTTPPRATPSRSAP